MELVARGECPVKYTGQRLYPVPNQLRLHTNVNLFKFILKNADKPTISNEKEINK